LPSEENARIAAIGGRRNLMSHARGAKWPEKKFAGYYLQKMMAHREAKQIVAAESHWEVSYGEPWTSTKRRT
jgi:hypothetical protein